MREFDARCHRAIRPGVREQVAVIRNAAETARNRTELSRLVDAYGAQNPTIASWTSPTRWPGGALLARCRRYASHARDVDVVLLDEYQDTSVAQRDLLAGLFKGLPVTAVGDPAQGIYGGAGPPPATSKSSSRTFRGRRRSRPTVPLSVTNRCRPGRSSRQQTIISADYYATSKVVAPLTSAKPAGGQVDVALYPTVDAEIEAMVGQITAAHAAGVPLAASRFWCASPARTVLSSPRCVGRPAVRDRRPQRTARPA